MVLLNEGVPSFREIDTDVGFVQALVGDLHIGEAFTRGDVQFSVAFKAFHTANISLHLLAYSGNLLPVIRRVPNLTTLIVKSCI